MQVRQVLWVGSRRLPETAPRDLHIYGVLARIPAHPENVRDELTRWIIPGSRLLPTHIELPTYKAAPLQALGRSLLFAAIPS